MLRVALALLLLLAASSALTSCMQSSEYVGDRLWGGMVVAQKSSGDANGATGASSGAPRIEVPQSMAGNVVAEDYDSDGFRGTRITYSALPLGQFNQLGDLLLEAYPNSSVSMQLTTKRNGDVVRMRGSADLTALASGRDLVTLSVRFAGPISATNGKQSADDTVTWTPQIGATSDLAAEADYPDPGTAAFGDWTWLLVGLTLAVVLIVGAVAYLTRDTSPRVTTTPPNS
ncbi:hypothetical protein GCM10009722_38140 [Williamsia deligens]|nr:hypothetical protein [Williamsia deligens]